MKLYLSSFGIGNHSNKLQELTGTGKQAVVIMNAGDHDPEARNKWLSGQLEDLSNLGYKVKELDLRNYFNKKDELEKLLKTIDLVWVTGGNTFILRRAMKQSGFDDLITNFVKTEQIAYAGFSAGSVVLHKDLHGIDITDDPNIIPEGYDKEIIWEGLGLIDFCVAVHYESDNSEIEYYKSNNLPYETLRDGDVLVINGDKKVKYE